MPVKNLWGDLPSGEGIRTPLTILREQASMLGEMTNNLLEAQILTNQVSSEDMLHTFQIVAPALDNYTFNLFRVQHGVHLYPLAIIDIQRGVQLHTPDEPSFEEKLEEILTSEQTRRLVAALLAQIRSAD